MDKIQELENEITNMKHDMSLLRASMGVMLFRDYKNQETNISTAELTQIINEGYSLFAATKTENDPDNFLNLKLSKKEKEDNEKEKDN